MKRALTFGTVAYVLSCGGSPPASAARIYWGVSGNLHGILTADLGAPDPATTIEPVVGGFNTRDLVVDPVNEKLYWGTSDYPCEETSLIQRSNLDGSDVETLFVGECPVNLALDVDAGHLYWTSLKSGPGGGEHTNSVVRSDLDGTNRQPVFQHISSFEISGIAVDSAGGNYFLSYGDRIRRYSLDGGSDLHTAFVPPSEGPLKLDPESGYLYWEVSDSIYRGDINNIVEGGSSELFLFSALTGGQVKGIDIDEVDRKLYWVADSSIYRSDLDGSNVQEILPLAGTPYTAINPIAVFNPAPPILLGDMDIDLDVDFDDIAPFVLALNNETAYEMMFGVPPELHGDIDGSGNHDFDDIPGFVAIIVGGEVNAKVQAVPEPSGFLLVTVCVVGLVGFGRWTLRPCACKGIRHS